MLKAEGLFFFEQNNPKRFQNRRARIFDDLYSNSEDRERITFPGGKDAEVVPSISVAAGSRVTAGTGNNCGLNSHLILHL